MPLPTPNKNEEKQEFLERCMSNNKMKEEFPNNSNRYAVCNTKWEEKEEGEEDEES